MNRGAKYTQMEFILFLLGGPSMHRLREEIFKSGLHPSLDPLDLTSQQDAAYFAELLIDHLLPGCKFKWQEQATTLDDAFPGIQFNGPVDLQTTLHVSLRAKEKELARQIHWILFKHYNTQKDPDLQRKFNPKDKDAVVIDKDKAALVIDKAEQKVEKFVQEYRLKELPSVLAIQMKRFKPQATKSGYTMVKDDSSVELPPDGIIDLSSYYDAPAGQPAAAKYQIKSYVVHKGTYHGGHYVAYVEIKGRYYLCDDLDSQFYREISKDDFYKNENAYLIFLERK
jgi:hypothetical protein